MNGTKRRGIGVGVHGNADIGEDAAEAYVQLGYNGTATIFLCVAEHGTGQKSNYAKMVAEVLRDSAGKDLHDPCGLPGYPPSSSAQWAPGVPMPSEAPSLPRRKTRSGSSSNLPPPKLGREPEELDTADGVVFVKEKP